LMSQTGAGARFTAPRGVAESVEAAEVHEYAPDHLLVAFQDAAPLAARLQAVQRLGLQVDLQRRSPYFAVLQITDAARAQGLTVEEAAALLSRDPAVRIAEPDYVVHGAHTPPNDPNFSQQWGLQAVRAPQAWDTTTGSPQVIVAVIDTGVDDTNPDLKANILTDGQGHVVGRNYSNGGDSPNPMDDNSHGSACAGIIGAVGNNGAGMVGVNWQVRIMPLKFLDANSRGNDSDA